MEFYIKKGATLPILKFKIVKDGRSDFHRFYNYVNTDALYFSMREYQTKIPKVTSRNAKFTQSNVDGEYYIEYQLKHFDTNKVGRYEGQFYLKTDEGAIIFDLKDKIYINVVDSITSESLGDDGCYNSDNPCCPVPSFTPTPSQVPDIILGIEYSGGSIILDYTLTTSFLLSENFDLSFVHTLEFYDNTTIVLYPEITIPFGSSTGSTQIIVDADFNNLKFINNITNITSNIPNFKFDFQVNPLFPTPTPTPTPSSTFGVTPTPTPTPSGGHPSNDLTYLIIPNDDFYYEIIYPTPIITDFNYLVIPNNDLYFEILIPTPVITDLTFSIIPENDLEFNILQGLCSSGGSYTLVVEPYDLPSSGNIIFPGFTIGIPSGITNPNTFNEDAVYWNVVDSGGINREEYFLGLVNNPCVVYFTQNGDTAIYSGDANSFAYLFNIVFHDLLFEGTNPITLIQPSQNDFVVGQKICITYDIIPNPPSPTITPTPSPTITPTVTPTVTPTPTMPPNYWSLTNCSTSITIVVNFGGITPIQGKIYNITFTTYFPPNNWNCWSVDSQSVDPPYTAVSTINSGPYDDCPSCPLV